MSGRRLRPGGDRGAGTLDYVGSILIVAAVVVAVSLSLVASRPELPLARAVCRILSLGQGDCGGDSLADRIPTQPCVVRSNQSTKTVRAGVAVIGQGTERWLIEELSDGRFRLTRSTGGGAGATVGAGFDLTGTWNDQDYGFSLGADANALAIGESGEVYYAGSKNEAEDFLSRRRWDQALDNTVGHSGPARWVADKIRGGDDLPDPDETWVAAGTTGDAKATVDWIAMGAQADIDTTVMLGSRLRKDGSGTAYYSMQTNGQVSASMWAADSGTQATTLYKAQAAGSVKGMVEIDYDSKGNVTALRVRSTVGGQAAAGKRVVGGDSPDGPNSYVDLTMELPIRTAEDRKHAAGMAAALGIPYVPGLSTGPRSSVLDPVETASDVVAFVGDARDHGRLWQDDYDLNLTTDAAFTLDAEWITGVMVEGSSNSIDRTSIGQQYFDGTGWRPREGCGA